MLAKKAESPAKEAKATKVAEEKDKAEEVVGDLDDVMAAPSAQDEKTKKEKKAKTAETTTRVVLDEEEGGEVVVHEYSDSEEEDAEEREKRKVKELERLQKEEQKKKQKKERKQKEDSDFIMDDNEKPLVAKRPKKVKKPAEEVCPPSPLPLSSLSPSLLPSLSFNSDVCNRERQNEYPKQSRRKPIRSPFD